MPLRCKCTCSPPHWFETLGPECLDEEMRQWKEAMKVGEGLVKTYTVSFLAYGFVKVRALDAETAEEIVSGMVGDGDFPPRARFQKWEVTGVNEDER